MREARTADKINCYLISVLYFGKVTAAEQKKLAIYTYNVDFESTSPLLWWSVRSACYRPINCSGNTTLKPEYSTAYILLLGGRLTDNAVELTQAVAK